jgi:hypothetical protein
MAPSTSLTLDSRAGTRVDVAAITLCHAMQADDEHAGRPPVLLAQFEPEKWWLRLLQRI